MHGHGRRRASESWLQQQGFEDADIPPASCVTIRRKPPHCGSDSHELITTGYAPSWFALINGPSETSGGPLSYPCGTLDLMDIVIRQAHADEYDDLGEITAQAYLQDGLLDFGESDWYLGELRDVAKRAAAADVLVALDGDRLLGGVTFVPSGGPMADIARPGEAEIRMLAVDRAARGRGAGEALVRACVDRARATDGCVRVILSTQRAMHSAHRIYERLGFTRTPERDWNPIPHLDDIFLLTYELTL